MRKNLRPEQVRFRRAVKKTAIVALTTLAALFAGIKIGQNQEKKNTQQVLINKNEAEKRADYFQKDAADLALQNIELRRFAEDAQMLGESMKFYPTNPDGISALPEEEQEKASKKLLEEDKAGLAKHNEAIATLGIDTNLLFRVQSGPKLEK